MTRVGLFRYIPHASLDAFLRRGWMVVADLGPVHGCYSSLCWHCGGDCGVQP